MKNLKINNYYPLSYELGYEKESDPQTLKISAEELLDRAFEMKMSAVQVTALFLKNAFEGYLCVMNDVPVKDLVEQGTVFIDLEASKKYGDLAERFFDNMHIFREGLDVAWDKATARETGWLELDYPSMECFVLGYQLFRLPVSCLTGFDPVIFAHVSEYKASQLKLHCSLHMKIIHHVACWEYIESVGESYNETFRDLIMKIETKENTLIHLKTKLEFANDPEIENEEMLNEMYFKYLVMRDTSMNEQKSFRMRSMIQGEKENKKLRSSLSNRIKSLYRTISKNCREVHIRTDGSPDHPELNDCFIKASDIYHDLSMDVSNQLLQYMRMLLLLIKVVNFRKINELPVELGGISNHDGENAMHLNELDVPQIDHNLEINLKMSMEMYGLSLKVRYIQDEELAEIHREYLLRHVEFIEKQIKGVMKEIRDVMQNKLILNNI